MNKNCKIHGDTLEERFDNDMKVVWVCVHCQLDEALDTLAATRLVRDEWIAECGKARDQRDEAWAELAKERVSDAESLAMYRRARDEALEELALLRQAAEIRVSADASIIASLRAELAKASQLGIAYYNAMTKAEADRDALRAASEPCMTTHCVKPRDHLGGCRCKHGYSSCPECTDMDVEAGTKTECPNPLGHRCRMDGICHEHGDCAAPVAGPSEEWSRRAAAREAAAGDPDCTVETIAAIEISRAQRRADRAAPEAGPKPDAHTYWCDQVTIGGFCNCGGVQQTPAQPEEGK